MVSTKPTTILPMPNSAVVNIKSGSSQATELESLNAHLKHISEKIIAQSPYLLTVPPCGEEFRLTRSQAIDWTKNTPFHPGEEELQYVSFLDRSRGDTVIKAVGGWDNGKGELIDVSPNGMRGGKSGTTTPKQGGKKMTLADYKNKKANGQLAAKDRLKPNGTDSLPPQVNGAESQGAIASSTMPTQEQTKKRSINDVDTPGPPPTTSQNSHQEPPAKKPRPTPSPPASSTSKEQPQVEPRFKIPPLLSPTLPAVIESILARKRITSPLEANKSNSKAPSSSQDTSKHHQSSSQSSSSRNSIESKTTKKEPKIKVEDHAHQPASAATRVVKASNKTVPSAQSSQGSSKVAVKSSLGNSPLMNGTHPKQAARGASVELRGVNAKNNTSSHAQKDEREKESLIVRLKISKARRKDVNRLLQTKPAKAQPKSTPPVKVEERQTIVKQENRDRSQTSKGEKAKVQRVPEYRTTIGQQKITIRREEIRVPAPGPSKPKEKRARAEEDADSSAPQSKRQKQPSNLDMSQKPSTPVPPPFKSPTVSTHGSAQKFADSKSGPSRRLEIGDTDIVTPQGSVRGGTPLAPNSIDKANRDGRSASNTSSGISSLSGNSEEAGAWRAELNKYQNLGRTLKREADQYSNQLSDKDEPQMEKKMIAVSIESILAFMLGYTILDEIAAPGKSSRKALNVKMWETILGFLGTTVQKRCQGHTLVHGLCLQLEAVCRNLIANAEIERLAQTQPPVRQAEEASAKATSETSQHTDHSLANAKIAENHAVAQKRWLEGAFELSIDDLQQSFPTSWKLKSRAPLARAKEKLTLGSFNGDFYLPLSNISTGIEAVRAGWSLLGEWCKKEDVDWTGKLGL